MEYAWTRTIGGSGEDHANDLALDDDGNLLITGRFSGTVDFDPTGGTDFHTSFGREDVFVTKLDPDGGYLWTCTFGGPATDIGYGVATDSAGAVVVTGWFRQNVDFNPTGDSDVHTACTSDGVFRGYEDVFVTKLNADGSYAWTRTFGASGSDRAHAVATDSDDNVLIVGAFHYTVDFDPTTGLDEQASYGGWDVFVTKLAPDGTYAWTGTMGGDTSDLAFGVAADADDYVLVTGTFYGTADLDPGPGTDYHHDGGAFITKLAADGSYAWTRSFGINTGQLHQAVGLDITADRLGEILTTGYYVGWQDLDPTSGVDFHPQYSSGVAADYFVSKLHSDGSYAWAYSAGGSLTDRAHRVAVAPDGDVLLAGFYTRSIYFDAAAEDDYRRTKGWRDVFVTRLSPEGEYRWTRTVGGLGYEEGAYALEVDPLGHVYTAGRFELTADFDPGEGLDERQAVGEFDLFVTKLASVTPYADCNSNGIADECDLARGTSYDQNTNGIPDECEECPCGDGDADGNSTIDLADFALLAPCLTGPDKWPGPDCGFFDLDCDCDVDLADFAAFQNAFTVPPSRGVTRSAGPGGMPLLSSTARTVAGRLQHRLAVAAHDLADRVMSSPP